MTHLGVVRDTLDELRAGFDRYNIESAAGLRQVNQKTEAYLKQASGEEPVEVSMWEVK